MATDGYEWDVGKAAANLRKHGVDFADAVTGKVMRRSYDFSTARRGSIRPLPTGKTRITIRLDDDVLQWFKAEVHSAGGGNYQTLINAALREYIGGSTEPLEETLRRVLREELTARTRNRR